MNGSASRVARLMRDDKELACGYERAFGIVPAGDDERLLVDAAKAMAAFQATLVSPRTPFDEFRDALVAGDRTAAARYPVAAQRGLKLFLGPGNCNACHFGPRFTNGEFGDVGIPFFVRPGEVDTGRLGGLAKLFDSPFNQVGKYNDDPSGRSAGRTRHVQRLHTNFGEFRVPGLRQVGRSGPYMHNGSLATLEDVVRHYSEVNPDRLHSDGTPLVRPLALSPQQSADLVAFLRSLDCRSAAAAGAAAALPLTQPRQRALQDPCRRRRVDALGALGATHVVVVDHAARHGRRAETLVLQHDGKGGESRRAVGGDVGRELADRLAARAFGAVHVERQADRQRLDLVLLREIGEGREVGRELAALERRERCRQHAQRVGCGDADRLAADVERHQSPPISHIVSYQQRLQFGEVDDRHSRSALLSSHVAASAAILSQPG